MKLKVKDMDIKTGGVLVAILNQKDAELMDLHPLDRIKIKNRDKIDTVVLDVATSNKEVRPGSIGVFDDVMGALKLKDKQTVEIITARKPVSIDYIKKKLEGKLLTKKEINQIVWDIVHNKLSDIELTYFVAACYSNELSMKETIWLTKAMTSHGDILRLKKYPVLDKHCVGGVAGNRTTPIVVSIIAAAGLTIPKTSSRSITSPAGTADTMEVLTDVSLSMSKMKKVVEKTNGCLVWGGALNLAPSDDKIIKVEKPLSIDAKSQLLSSVMAKKLSVSATHLLIDIPMGKGSKITSMQKAKLLKKDFESIAQGIGIKIKVVMTDGTQPIGNGIGPALEAKDVLYVLTRDKKAPLDLRNKALRLAGLMLEISGRFQKGKGVGFAREILDSGKAYSKFIDIIKAQGMNCKDPKKINVGRFKYDLVSKRNGKIHSISNRAISKVARVAGAPDDAGAGIYLYKHVGDNVVKGEKIFTLYSHNKVKLGFAKDALEKLDGIVIN